MPHNLYLFIKIDETLLKFPPKSKAENYKVIEFKVSQNKQ